MTTPNSPTVAAPISAATPPGAPLPVEEVVAPVRGNASARPPLGCLCGGTYRTEYRPQWDGDVDTVLVCRSCGQEP